MGHSYGLLTAWDSYVLFLWFIFFAWDMLWDGTFLCFINCMVHSYHLYYCMGHCYRLLTEWGHSYVLLIHRTFLWLINFMGQSYGLLTSWDIPMVY